MFTTTPGQLINRIVYRSPHTIDDVVSLKSGRAPSDNGLSKFRLRLIRSLFFDLRPWTPHEEYFTEGIGWTPDQLRRLKKKCTGVEPLHLNQPPDLPRALDVSKAIVEFMGDTVPQPGNWIGCWSGSSRVRYWKILDMLFFKGHVQGWSLNAPDFTNATHCFPHESKESAQSTLYYARHHTPELPGFNSSQLRTRLVKDLTHVPG